MTHFHVAQERRHLAHGHASSGAVALSSRRLAALTAQWHNLLTVHLQSAPWKAPAAAAAITAIVIGFGGGYVVGTRQERAMPAIASDTLIAGASPTVPTLAEPPVRFNELAPPQGRIQPFDAVLPPSDADSIRSRQPTVVRVGTRTPRNMFVGTVSVSSTPSGADVSVDGKRVGTTPLNGARISAGTHVLRVEHAGYQRWSSLLRVVADERTRVTASLER